MNHKDAFRLEDNKDVLSKNYTKPRKGEEKAFFENLPSEPPLDSLSLAAVLQLVNAFRTFERFTSKHDPRRWTVAFSMLFSHIDTYRDDEEIKRLLDVFVRQCRADDLRWFSEHFVDRVEQRLMALEFKQRVKEFVAAKTGKESPHEFFTSHDAERVLEDLGFDEFNFVGHDDDKWIVEAIDRVLETN